MYQWNKTGLPHNSIPPTPPILYQDNLANVSSVDVPLLKKPPLEPLRMTLSRRQSREL